MTYLVDTNVFSRLLLPEAPPALVERYDLERERGELATAGLVLHEIRFGAELLPARSRRRAVILEYLARQVGILPVLPYEESAAIWHAEERARLRRRGESPPFADGQIAAIAAVNRLTLVTGNVRDFASFRGLTVQSW